MSTTRTWIVIHLVVFMHLVNANDESDLITSICDGFGFKSVVLICEETRTDGDLYKMMELQRTLNRMIKVYTSILSFKNLEENFLGVEHEKSLVVIRVLPETLKIFTSLSKDIELYRMSWLWISSSLELDVNAFRDVYIPFNAKFFYAFRAVDGFVIKDIYQKSQSLNQEVKNYGKWEKEKGLTVVEGEFFNRRRDLTHLHLKFFLNAGLGSCDLEFSGNPTVNDCLHWRIWNDLQGAFNFTSEFIVQKKNMLLGRSEDIMEQIKNHEVDSASLSFIITSERLTKYNFLWPTMRTSFFIYTKVPDVEINFSSYLQPLSFNLWLAVLAWTIVMAASMTVTKWIIVRLLANRKFHFLRDGVDDSTAPFSALCSQSTCIAFGEEMVTVRMFIMMIYIVSLFLLPAYSGGLISSLGNPPSRVPFTNIDEFGKNGKYKIITLSGSFVHEFLRSDTVFAGVRKKKLTWSAEDMPTGDVQAFNLTCQNALSYFIDQPVFLKDRPPCKLFTMKQLFGQFSGSFSVAKDFPFTELFNRVMQRNTICGITRKMLEKIVMDGLQIEVELQTAKSSDGVFQELQFEHTKAFTLSDVFPIFLTYLTGLILSVLVLLIELYYWKTKAVLGVVP